MLKLFITESFPIFLCGDSQQRTCLENSQNTYNYYSENMIANNSLQKNYCELTKLYLQFKYFLTINLVRLNHETYPIVC